jgi:acetoin utilization protein AcuB
MDGGHALLPLITVHRSFLSSCALIATGGIAHWHRGKKDNEMIVSEVMTTEIVTVTPADSLSHVANLLRQHQFHHAPVVRGTGSHNAWGVDRLTQSAKPLLEGLITSQDIELAVAGEPNNAGGGSQQPWQERRVVDVMQRSVLCVTPTTSITAAAKLLVERGINCLPVVEYGDSGNMEENSEGETLAYLVGLLTRSDLLLALARALGGFEPGMELLIPLHAGNLTPLANMLLLAANQHVAVQSVLVVPLKDGRPGVATVRLGTINPTPLLKRLQQAGIAYEFADFQSESGPYAR